MGFPSKILDMISNGAKLLSSLEGTCIELRLNFVLLISLLDHCTHQGQWVVAISWTVQPKHQMSCGVLRRKSALLGSRNSGAGQHLLNDGGPCDT